MTKKQWKTLSFVIGTALLILAMLVNFYIVPNILFGQNASVTNLGQLTDVRPTDWHFTALQSLEERYGLILQYRDKSFRANRPITRGENSIWVKQSFDKFRQVLNQDLQSKATDQELSEIKQLIAKIRQELKTIK